MRAFCRHCHEPLDPAALLENPRPECPHCHRAIFMSNFRELAAPRDWRSETCGTCAFRIDTGQCRRLPPTPVALGAGREDAREWYPLVKKDTPACAEWAERRGE